MFRHFDVARPIDAPVEFAEYGAQLLHKGLDGQSPFDEPSELLLCDCIQQLLLTISAVKWVESRVSTVSMHRQTGGSIYPIFFR